MSTFALGRLQATFVVHESDIEGLIENYRLYKQLIWEGNHAGAGIGEGYY